MNTDKTGAQIVLNWMKEFEKMTGQFPKPDEIIAQLEMAIDHDREMSESIEEGIRQVEEMTRNDKNLNDVIYVAEKLYYEANPETKMDVPSFVYEKVEAANKKRLASGSELNLYHWYKENYKA